MSEQKETKIPEENKRTKTQAEIDDEYKATAALLGDRMYKMKLLDAEIGVLFHKLNALVQESHIDSDSKTEKNDEPHTVQ